MTLLLRDEEDILEDLVAFHLSRGVDFIVATDNLSRDRTPLILERYRRLGVMQVIQERRDDYMQHAWVTRMARIAATEHGADWVINGDADEFWFPDAGGAGLKDVLGDVPAGVGAVTVARDNFPIVPTAVPESSPFFERLTWRDTQSVQALGLPLPPKVAHRADPRVEVAQGNHTVRVMGEEPGCVAVPMRILHFPARSYPQFHRKILSGGAAYARNRSLGQAVGRTWRVLHQALRDGRLPEEFRRQNPDGAEFESQVAAGRLVEDFRLRDALRSLRAASKVGGR